MKSSYTVGLAVFAFLLPIAAQTAGAQTNPNMVGVWQAKEGALTITLSLNAEGTGKLDDSNIKYLIKDNTLTVDEGGIINKYTYQLSGNRLTLSGADLQKPMIFERQGAPITSGLGARRAQPAPADNPQPPPAAIRKPPPPAIPTTGPAGAWETKGASGALRLILKPDGTGTFGGGAILWQFNQGVLSLTGPNGVPVVYNATITQNSLTVTGGNLTQPVVFQSVTSEAGSAANPPPGPAGVWETQGPSGALRLILKPDRTGTFGGGAIRWQFNQGALTLTGPNGIPVVYNAVLAHNSLTLTGGNLTQPVVFQSTASEAGMTAPKAAAETSGKTGLVGNWQGPQGIIQINADGTMLIQGVTYRYTVQGSMLTLIGNDGSLPMPFVLNGDNLTVTISGQTAMLKRLTADAAGQPPAGAGSVPAELAGKWCYFSSFSANAGGGSMTDECFTLFPNGSYQYHREASISAYSTGIYGGTASQNDDAGTWQVHGSTVTVASRTRGTNSYSLEKRNHQKTGDPMLCLDGRCFVTTTQRPPWR